MNGYVCFYKEKRIEVYAENPLQARQEVAKQLKVKKHYDITVILAERNGKEVIHTAS